MQWIVGGRAVAKRAASANQMGSFAETGSVAARLRACRWHADRHALLGLNRQCCHPRYSERPFVFPKVPRPRLVMAEGLD